MKIITESDLFKIVNKVLNEQDERQFDDDEIDLLNFIFEREFKPPFKQIKNKTYRNVYSYYNRDDDYIGWLASDHTILSIKYDPYLLNIKYKVCSVFGFSKNTEYWWHQIELHLKSWMENKLNIKLNALGVHH